MVQLLVGLRLTPRLSPHTRVHMVDYRDEHVVTGVPNANTPRTIDADNLENAGQRQETDTPLDNPLYFRTRHLYELTDQLRDPTMPDTERQNLIYKFRDLTGYYISVAQTSQKAVPPRILFDIYGNFRLRNLLPVHMRTEIKARLDKETQMLSTALESDVSTWDVSQATRLIQAYRHIERSGIINEVKLKGESTRGSIDRKFEQARDAIITLTQTYLDRYLKRRNAPARSVEQIISGEHPPELPPGLTNTEKLLTLEARKLFPSSHDWGIYRDFAHWEDLTQEVVAELLPPVDSQLSPQQRATYSQNANNPNYLLAWDLLDDFMESPQAEFAGFRMGSTRYPEARHRLEDLVIRGNAAQFLGWAQKSPVLLPAHVRTLRDILIHPEFRAPAHNYNESQWLDVPQPLKNKIADLKEKIAEQETEMDRREEDQINVFLRQPENQNDEDADTYRSSRADVTQSRRVLLREMQPTANYAPPNTTNVIEVAQLDAAGTPTGVNVSVYAANGANLHEFTHRIFYPLASAPGANVLNPKDAPTTDEVDRVNDLAHQFQERWDALTNRFEAGEDTPAAQALRDKKQNEAMAEFVNGVSQLGSRSIRRTTFFQTIQNAQSTFQTHTQKQNEAKAKIKEKGNFAYEEGMNEELGTLKKQLKESQTEVWKHLDENENRKQFAALLADPHDLALKTKRQYERGLNSRLQNGRLMAADMQVLLLEDDGHNGANPVQPGPASTEQQQIHEFLAATPGGMQLSQAHRQTVSSFRTVMVKAIDDALASIRLPKITHPEDQFAQWYKALDRVMSSAALLEAMQKDRHYNELNFGLGQDMLELIDGGVGYYRYRIIDTLMGKMGLVGQREKAEAFFAEWQRPHMRTIDSRDIEAQGESSEKKRRRLKEIQKRININQKNHDAYMTSISEFQINQILARYTALTPDEQFALRSKLYKAQNRADLIKQLQKVPWTFDPDYPPKGWSLSQIADRIMLDQTWTHNRNQYRNGGQVEVKNERGEVTDSFYVPGSEALAEAGEKTRRMREKIQTTTKRLTADLAALQTIVREVNQGKRTYDKEKYQKIFENTVKSFTRAGVDLRSAIRDMYFICRDLLPRDMLHTLFIKNANTLYGHIGRYGDKLAQMGQTPHYVFGDESPFIECPKYLNMFDHVFDFETGFYAQEADLRNRQLAQHARGLKVLKNLEFDLDETIQKDEFREKAEEKNRKFRESYQLLVEESQPIIELLERDIKKAQRHHDPKWFSDRYGLSVAQASREVDRLKHSIDRYATLQDEFSDPQFFAQWLGRYNTDPQTRAEAVTQLAGWEVAVDLTDKALDQVAKIRHYLDEHGLALRAPGTKFRDIIKDKVQNEWGEWMNRGGKSFSINELVELVKKCIEFQETQFNRQKEARVGTIGYGIFGDKFTWGKEFFRMMEESEEKRFKEFETQHADQDISANRDALYKTRDVDEARGLINVLRDKGILMWDDPGLWKTLERFQTQVKFRKNDLTNLKYAEIQAKVEKAIGLIWSPQVFRDWETSMDGKAKEKQSSYDREFGSYEDNGSVRTEILADMLSRWEKGDTENIDPARFEQFIRASFEKGKMNGQPDQRFYYLIMGMATTDPRGIPLLSRNAAIRMNDQFLGGFPVLEFWTEGGPKKDGLLVDESVPGAESRPWNFHDFKCWKEMLGDDETGFNVTKEPVKAKMKQFWYSVVLQSDKARGRVMRNMRMSDEKADHDEAMSQFPFFPPDQIVQMLERNNNGKDKYTPDYYRMLFHGFRGYAVGLQKHIQDYDERFGQTQWWAVKKKELLTDFGRSLRAGMTGMMTMQGNHSGSGSNPTVFSEEMFEYDRGYIEDASKLSRSRDDIFTMFRNVMSESNLDDGKRTEYENYMQTKGNKYGSQWRNINKKLGPEFIDGVQKMISEDADEGAGALYTNTEAIQKALESFVTERTLPGEEPVSVVETATGGGRGGGSLHIAGAPSRGSVEYTDAIERVTAGV